MLKNRKEFYLNNHDRISRMDNNYLQYLKKRLRRYEEAEDAILSAQSYEIEGLKLTRADLELVQNMIAKLRAEISKQESILRGTTRSRVRYVVPVDGVERMRRRKIF